MSFRKKEEKVEVLEEEKCACGEACNCEENCDCGEGCTCGEACNCGNEQEARIAELEQQLAAIAEENLALVEKVKLSQAELVNYRCRKDKEVQDMLKYCNQGLVTELIPMVDNFERALKIDENTLTEDVKKFLQGFKMIYSSLSGVLANSGVTVIDRKGEVFDPNLEQALLTGCEESLENDVVLEVLQKGYKLKDRVIRPASVKINQK